MVGYSPEGNGGAHAAAPGDQESVPS
jgi:hypothetical protein